MSRETYCVHVRLFRGVRRHGGVRRTSQISESLSSLYQSKYLPIYIDDIKPFGVRYLLVILKNLGLILRFCLSTNLDLKLSVNAIIFSTFIFDHLKSRNISPKEAVFACETSYPGPSLAVSYYLQYCKHATFLFPHNIEFLVPGIVGRLKKNISLRANLFCLEMSVMANAKKVFSISRFDDSVLRCFSVNSTLYPYFPCKSDLIEFNSVRSCRQSLLCSAANHKYYLIFGSVDNPPSYCGMDKLLCAINASSSLSDISFYVAGYGTEKLEKHASSNVSILGSVSSDKLIDLLANCRAVIVSQDQTSGMLTRLVELNLSMVPVVLAKPYIQAENLAEYSIFCLQNLDQLHNVLNSLSVDYSNFKFFGESHLPSL